MKSTLLNTFKLTLAGVLIYWLIRTEKITAEPFRQLWATPWLIPFVFGVIGLLIVINNYRWQLLLEGQDILTSFKQTLPLTFIGLFFNLAMPGSVGGDVIKAYYIAQEKPGTKLKAATSVLMDRIVGLFAMGIIASVAIATNWERIANSAHLRALAISVFAVLFIFIIFFSLGFSRRVRAHDLTNSVLNKLPASRLFTRLYDAIHSFKDGRREFVIGIGLSLLVQSLNIVCLYVLAVALGYENITLAAFFFIIPLGLIATAVPISPAGIGVGQAVFFQLFAWYQSNISPTLGPTIITIYQVTQAALSLIGAYFYFTRKPPASYA